MLTKRDLSIASEREDVKLVKTLREALQQGWVLVDAAYGPGLALVERRRSDGCKEAALCVSN
jgi:hypothetical protein